MPRQKVYLIFCMKFRSSHRSCSVKKAIFKNIANFAVNHLCSIFFLVELQALRPATLLKKTPTKVFFYEHCKIFKNTSFEEKL